MSFTPEIPDLDTAWMGHAACAHAPDLPWIETDPRPSRGQVRIMRCVCAACPVRAACEAFAHATRASAGWWAGRNFNRISPYDSLNPEPEEAA